MESHACAGAARASTPREYARPEPKVYGSAAEVTLTNATGNDMNDPGDSSQTRT